MEFLLIFIIAFVIYICIELSKEPKEPTNEDIKKFDSYKIFYHDFYYNWEHDGQTFVPEEYHKFFTAYPKSLEDYCVAWCAKEQHDRGLEISSQTISFLNRNNEKFDPYVLFKSKWDGKMQEFNNMDKEMITSLEVKPYINKTKPTGYWDTGRFDPVNEKLHDFLWQDFFHNWSHEGKTFVPKEYRDYLDKNNKAFLHYLIAWCANEEHKKGFRPARYDGYDKRNFDPFRGFRVQWDEKINILNETGRYYY